MSYIYTVSDLGFPARGVGQCVPVNNFQRDISFFEGSLDIFIPIYQVLCYQKMQCSRVN